MACIGLVSLQASTVGARPSINGEVMPPRRFLISSCTRGKVTPKLQLRARTGSYPSARRQSVDRYSNREAALRSADGSASMMFFSTMVYLLLFFPLFEKTNARIEVCVAFVIISGSLAPN